VDILLRLDLDYSLVGPRNSHQREAFANHLCQDLSNASGLPATNFLIKDMSPGSILVMTEIRAHESNMAISPEAVARDLESQATDPRSRLRSGGITRFTESITLKARLATSPQPKGMMQRSAPPLSPSSNPPVSPNPNAAPAPPLLPPSPDRQEASLLDATGPKTGVGIVFKRNELGEIEVIGLRPGSSSEQCGAIFVGNKIISIGPVPVTGSSKETVIDLIVGTPGTRVTLGMLREAGSPGTDNGQSTQVSVTLIRAEAPLAPPSQPVSAAPLTAPRAPSSGSAPPMMDPPGTMTQSQTISKAKEPFEFVGPPRTVALERGMARHGEQAGVGVSFQATKSSGHMVVTKLVPDGPADVCKHVMVGDIILRVNNVPVQSKRIPQVVSLIKGPPGTLVVFTLQSTSLNPNAVASQGTSSLYNSVSSHAGTRGLGYESHDSAPPMSAPPSARIADSAPEEAPLPQGWEKTMLPDGNAVYVNHAQKAFSKVRPQSPARQSRPWQEERLPEMAAALGIRVVRVQRRSLIPNGKAGIGLGFERDQEGTHFVCGLLPDGSAAQSGQIFVYDKIISVDGRPTQGKTIDEVSEMIQGIEGTDVALTLETTAEPQPPVVTQSVELSDVANASGLVGDVPPAQDGSADVYIAGLVISEPPFQVLGLDRLSDSKGLVQGQEGYQNEIIGTGDAVWAINGKMLKNETSQGLIDSLSGPLNSTVEVMIAQVKGSREGRRNRWRRVRQSMLVSSLSFSVSPPPSHPDFFRRVVSDDELDTLFQGDFMFSAKLARNMLLADYSSWCEYLSCPVSARVQVSPSTNPHDKTHSHATDDAREGAFENMAQGAEAQDAQDVASRLQAQPELLPQSGLPLSVRVLQVCVRARE
jgi:C-terminal processing protease CtpA/Prc